MKPIRSTLFLSIVVLVISACNLSGPPQESSAIATSAAQTVQVLLSPPVTSTPVEPLPGESPTAQATPTQTPGWDPPTPDRAGWVRHGTTRP